MRRTDRRIVDREHIERIIRSGRYATFALADDVEPYVVTMSYGYDPDGPRLYFHVAHEGRKLDIITRNPRACGTIVLDHGYNQGECEHPYESVVMHGTMRLVTDPAEKRHAIEVLVEHLEDDPRVYWESRSWDLEDRLAGFTALCFEIGEIDAKQGS